MEKSFSRRLMQKSASFIEGTMRTTLNIDDTLVTKAKTLAAQEHTSLTRLIEEGLALRLRAQMPPANHPRVVLPVFAGKHGLQPTVADALSNRALLDAADERS